MYKFHFLLKSLATVSCKSAIIAVLAVLNSLLLAEHFISRKRKRKRSVRSDSDNTFDSTHAVVSDYLKRLEEKADSQLNDLKEAEIMYRRSLHDRDFISRADDKIMKNFNNSEYGVSDLCSDLNMERSGVYKIIRRCTGMSPSEYINAARIRYAKKILDIHPDFPDDELAFHCGFITAKSMRIHFVRHAGMDIDVYRSDISTKINKVNEYGISDEKR